MGLVLPDLLDCGRPCRVNAWKALPNSLTGVVPVHTATLAGHPSLLSRTAGRTGVKEWLGIWQLLISYHPAIARPVYVLSMGERYPRKMPATSVE